MDKKYHWFFNYEQKDYRIVSGNFEDAKRAMANRSFGTASASTARSFGLTEWKPRKVKSSTKPPPSEGLF